MPSIKARFFYHLFEWYNMISCNYGNEDVGVDTGKWQLIDERKTIMNNFRLFYMGNAKRETNEAAHYLAN
jgi:hypothetical protein